MSLLAILVGGLLLVKAAERWAMPLLIRIRPRTVLDVSSIGFDADGGVDGGC